MYILSQFTSHITEGFILGSAPSTEISSESSVMLKRIVHARWFMIILFQVKFIAQQIF